LNYLEPFNDIETFIFDVDGVIAKSGAYVLDSGKLLRKTNTRDGFALRAAVNCGYRVAVISQGRCEGIKIRMQNIGVTDIYIGQMHKMEAYEELIHLYDLDSATILYMGDDLPDYEVMCKVGLPVCPHDAAPEIKEIARYISPLGGGEGCVRDVIEKVLKLHGKWHDSMVKTS